MWAHEDEEEEVKYPYNAGFNTSETKRGPGVTRSYSPNLERKKKKKKRFNPRY